jgi:hypothetical protein
MDSGVLRDTIPMLQELGWEDEVDRVSEILHRFPPYNSTTSSSVYASPCSHLKKTAAKLTRTFYQGGDIGETKYSSRASLCL